MRERDSYTIAKMYSQKILDHHDHYRAGNSNLEWTICSVVSEDEHTVPNILY